MPRSCWRPWDPPAGRRSRSSVPSLLLGKQQRDRRVPCRVTLPWSHARRVQMAEEEVGEAIPAPSTSPGPDPRPSAHDRWSSGDAELAEASRSLCFISDTQRQLVLGCVLPLAGVTVTGESRPQAQPRGLSGPAHGERRRPRLHPSPRPSVRGACLGAGCKHFCLVPSAFKPVSISERLEMHEADISLWG